ncbi:MAG: hypothetical protein WEB50_00975 [Vicinamibacterales bacterium]
MPTILPEDVTHLVRRVLTSPSAHSSSEVRRAIYDHVAALTRNEPPSAAVPPTAEPYLRKVALNAYKVLDREVDAMRSAGSTTDDIFEMTVAAALGAGVTRMEIALAALEETDDAPAS